MITFALVMLACGLGLFLESRWVKIRRKKAVADADTAFLLEAAKHAGHGTLLAAMQNYSSMRRYYPVLWALKQAYWARERAAERAPIISRRLARLGQISCAVSLMALIARATL